MTVEDDPLVALDAHSELNAAGASIMSVLPLQRRSYQLGHEDGNAGIPEPEPRLA